MGTFSLKEKYFKFILYILVIVLINIAGITLGYAAAIAFVLFAIILVFTLLQSAIQRRIQG